jgi:starch-binding outer membrane protein, SusD/RagB family
MHKLYKTSILLLALYAGSMVLNSCKKSWLAPKPESIYTADNTLIDVPGFKAALAGCATNLRQEYYGDGAPLISEYIFSEVSVEGTDDKTGPAQNMDNQIKPDANLNSVDFNHIGWYWQYEYIGIRNANTIIGRLPAAKAIPDSMKNILMGQAYFYRAFDYYRLTNQFGDVPCPTKEVLVPKVNYQTVKRDVILTQMKQDLETAVKYVPWVTDKGDVNRGACYHLLAKIDLALSLFDDAITAASAVINSGTFKLMTSRFGEDAGNPAHNITWDLHRPDNKSLAVNTEGLFLVTDRLGSAGAFAGGIKTMRNCVAGSSLASNIKTPNGNVGMSASANIEIDMMQTYGRGIGRMRSTPYHYKDIWDDPNDLRHDSTSGNWVYMENLRYSNPALKGVDPYYGQRLRLYSATGTLLCLDTLRDWFPWPHYKVYIPDTENTPMQGGHTDWYVFRLAETYLIRAEAYIWKGDLASAATDVNAVRTRAKCAPYTAANMSIGTVLDERARELYYEEYRKCELTRMAYIFAKSGLPYNGKTYSLTNFSTSNFMIDRILEKNLFYRTNFVTVHGDMFKISPYHVLWPIPQDAINANTDGHINQNIGYSGSSANVPALDHIVD